MCGLAGAVVSHVTNIKLSNFIRESFVAGSLRGMDSSGIAVINDSTEVSFYKQPINGSTFIQDRRASSLIDSVNKARTIAMTHTRAATVGSVNYNNAHPFQATAEDDEGYIVREIIGCHNGTLTGITNNAFGTDSEWAINKILAEKKEAFKSFSGAYAFTWWDSDDEEHLNMATNGQRDIYIAKLTNGGLLYASEAGMLHWLAERSGLGIEGNVLQLMPHMHYKFNVKNPCNYTKEELPKAAVTYTSTYSGYYTQRKSHFEAAQEVFEEAAASKVVSVPKKDLVPLVNSVPSANESQVAAAKEMDLFGVKGKFIPFKYNADEDQYEGIFSCCLTAGGDETDWSAVIVGYGKAMTLSKDIVWPVSIHGLDDDGTNILLYCSKPALQLVNQSSRAVN
ncbi:putative glutamine amidotransferase [Xanthomonas phage DES1]|nr:putative glutamine amidotransferase [Xanthomonas phage DES1]